MRKADDDAARKARQEERLRQRKEEAEKAKLRAARRAHMREKIGLIPNFERAILMFEGPEKGLLSASAGEGLGRQIRQGRAVSRLWQRADADARGARTTGWIGWRGRSRSL